ncbi:hypothetical protein CCHR01_12114 [Colletotrichum chrysophilum]|uniref:Uncharacterized protein n=1 Tax=Colletotrichum chrysophilum TaxID=1836956 RepID=A0AAD9ACI5_9PEZI|nr:hypothetical protein CCHR01_12114 [Colletotrichum chrysophilum]
MAMPPISSYEPPQELADSDGENGSHDAFAAVSASLQHCNDWYNRRQELLNTWLQEQGSILQPAHEGVMSAIDVVDEVLANAERLVEFLKENLDKANRMKDFESDKSPSASHVKTGLDELVAANKDTAFMVSQLKSTSRGLQSLSDKIKEFKKVIAQK